MQAFTFYASEDKLENRGNDANAKCGGCASINAAAASLAKAAAVEDHGDESREPALTLGGLSQCPSYLNGAGKAAVQKEFAKQVNVFVVNGLDFLLCEVF